MSEDGEEASLSWTEDGVPVSARFGDAYYSREDGLAETRHVFLDGNDFSRRWQGQSAEFRIAELGFGTGLSFLAAWQLWQRLAAPGAVLRFTSFERFPMALDEMARALGAFPELAPLAQPLLAALPERGGTADLGSALLEIVPGDARATLPVWTGTADAWFLDGFSPALNPEMWEPGLMREVFGHTRPGGSFATFTAAGEVRRTLTAAGFEVSRRPGYGRKRHMTAGRRAVA